MEGFRFAERLLCWSPGGASISTKAPHRAQRFYRRMLRQAQLWRVLGGRLTERLLRARWIEPVAQNSTFATSSFWGHFSCSLVQSWIALAMDSGPLSPRRYSGLP